MKIFFNTGFPVIILISVITLASCEKEVTIELPDYQSQIVVEGMIENGSVPIVILTRSSDYYDPINADVFSNLFVRDAVVKMVVDKKDTILLSLFCTDNLPDSVKDDANTLLNLPTGSGVNFCLYTSFDALAIGKPGSEYELIINAGSELLTSTSTIETPVPIDSMYWKPDGALDSLGFIFGVFMDPANDGSAYKISSQRINTYKYGKENGEIKDYNFITPFGAVFDDKFVNGQKVDFALNRGRIFGSEKEDDTNIERGYFKKGDTVLVKLSAVDRGVYNYYRSYYGNLSNSGSPFATPNNVEPNVKGGLGIWAAYGSYTDTIFIK